MGLKDFFRREKEPHPAMGVSCGDYWADVKTLCSGHISNTLEYFRAHNPPRLDWAEKAYASLTYESAVNRLVESARQMVETGCCTWAEMPVMLGVFDHWSTWLTVASTASDAEFLKHCPEGRVEPFLEACARHFRQREPDWQSLNYAQWILLLDQPQNDASIHLFTMWSIDNQTKWLMEKEGRVVRLAPAIVPTGLIRENASEFLQSMSRQAFTAIAEPHPSARSVGKMLFLDSATKEGLVFAENPVQVGVRSHRTGGWLDEVLRTHRADCDILQCDVPLWLGMPERFRSDVEAYFREVRFYGLRPDTITLFPEAEVPSLCIDSGIGVFRPNLAHTHLAGGGISLARWVESGELAKAWKSGTRWLLMGQAKNLEVRIIPTLLSKATKSAVLMEVTKRTVLPESLLLILINRSKRTLCVDDRTMRSEEMEALRKCEIVGTGTFWVNCKSLASAFGIGQEALEAPWNPSVWERRVEGPVRDKHAIRCFQDGEFGVVVPIWEMLSELDMESVMVGADRVRIV